MKIDFSQKLNLQNLVPETEFDYKVVQFLQEWFSNSATVSVQTSGSTGVPKIFEIEKEKMRNSAKMTCDFLGLNKGDSALLCLPVEYISGKMMLVRSIERKLVLHTANPSSKPMQQLHSEIDFCAMSPLQVENSLSELHLIKNLIIGGATVSEKLKEKIQKELKSEKHTSKNKIYETYGMSETLSHIALKQVFPTPEEYFMAFNNVEISLDQRGCLTIFAPQLNPEHLITNDLVELNSSPNFDGKKQFKFLGRQDNVINSGGLKIYPEQLENIMKKHVSSESVFLGIPDESLGNKLILVIEGEENNELNSQISNALEEIQTQFSKNHKPKEIRYIAKIPRTENGKVNRKELLLLI